MAASVADKQHFPPEKLRAVEMRERDANVFQKAFADKFEALLRNLLPQVSQGEQDIMLKGAQTLYKGHVGLLGKEELADVLNELATQFMQLGAVTEEFQKDFVTLVSSLGRTVGDNEWGERSTRIIDEHTKQSIKPKEAPRVKQKVFVSDSRAILGSFTKIVEEIKRIVAEDAGLPTDTFKDLDVSLANFASATTKGGFAREQNRVALSTPFTVAAKYGLGTESI